LIAKGDMNGIPLAERAINEYWDATLEKARKSGLRLIQQDVLGGVDTYRSHRTIAARVTTAR
jgi:hypothetical protein